MGLPGVCMTGGGRRDGAPQGVPSQNESLWLSHLCVKGDFAHVAKDLDDPVGPLQSPGPWEGQSRSLRWSEGLSPRTKVKVRRATSQELGPPEAGTGPGLILPGAVSGARPGRHLTWAREVATDL